MKKLLKIIAFSLSLLISVNGLAQTETAVKKMPVPERMAKARVARAENQAAKAKMKQNVNHDGVGNRAREEQVTSADYKSPVIKTQRGPNGETIHTGARGAKYYINKNGNKTYLSSNQ